MAARFAWVLNLDADVELAAIASGAAGARTGYSPKQSVADAMRAFVPKLAASLLDLENDVVIDEASPALSARGLIGRAFCPTPRAVRLLLRAGAEPEAHPDCDAILLVNSRAFCSSLGETLPGAAFVTTEDEARIVLASTPPRDIANAWRVKRNFGMTGRGQRVVVAGRTSNSDFAFVRAGLSEGGVQIEPNVSVVSEFAIHGMTAANGALKLGPVVKQQCNARGAWISSECISAAAAPAGLAQEAERVAAALFAAKYFGPFGIDAYTYKNGDAIALQRRSEINARYTMGFAAYTVRVRWLYHLRIVANENAWPYAPPSFANEHFIHASYRDAVRESAALYFPADATIEVLMIDPRKLSAKIEIASTPRGPMPHVLGSIKRSAVERVVSLADFDPKHFPDAIVD